jgi:hypothetical protein
VAFTVAGNEPLLVGWLKLKTNGGGLEVVVVEVVTVDPLGLVLHTPLAGVTVCALTGDARPPAHRSPKKAKRGRFCCCISEDRLQNNIIQIISQTPGNITEGQPWCG